jgi:hypothetical protein
LATNRMKTPRVEKKICLPGFVGKGLFEEIECKTAEAGVEGVRPRFASGVVKEALAEGKRQKRR